MYTTQQYSSSLRRALLANAIFSALTGLALATMALYFGQFLGVTNPLVLRIIGIGLLFFVVILLRTAVQQEINTQHVKVIISLDVLWVIGSITLLGLQLFSLSLTGYWAVAIIALIVAGLSYWQFRSLPSQA